MKWLITDPIKKRDMYSLLSFIIACCSWQLTWACGGLFCNTTQPVNQSAERILFAPDPTDDARIQMHVQIQYAGPPAEFSWMLPVPPDTDFKLSTDALFERLDNGYRPQFQLNRIVEEECPPNEFYNYGYDQGGVPNDPSSEAPPSPPPRVQVLSREIVGPYDKVVLTADTVEVLTEWLIENGYQVPDRADEVLSPYLDDFAFIAIRLTPLEGVDSIKPIALTFNSPAPSIPIIPTSVAAQPDMGILVHILGPSRAISTNYAHVHINEAVIDWQRGARNYSDVVSQAIDEAGGQAFVTDFAGEHTFERVLDLISSENLAQIEAARTLKQAIEAKVHTYLRDTSFGSNRNLDFGPAIFSHGVVTEQVWNEVINCLSLIEFLESFESSDDAPKYDYGYYEYEQIDITEYEEERMQCEMLLSDDEASFDGQAVAMALSEINQIYNNINTLFSNNPYLTRLYSTLSAEEMTTDPSFTYNQDLEDVDRTRRATLVRDCDGNNLELRLSDGNVIDLRDDLGPEMIERQDGETVRGMGEIAAQIIERQMPAGQSDLIEDRTAMIQNIKEPESGCQSTQWTFSPLLLIAFLSLLISKKRQII